MAIPDCDHRNEEMLSDRSRGCRVGPGYRECLTAFRERTDRQAYLPLIALGLPVARKTNELGLTQSHFRPRCPVRMIELKTRCLTLARDLLAQRGVRKFGEKPVTESSYSKTKKPRRAA